MMQPILVMMMGAKSAGKTWIAERLGCARACPDAMVPNTVPHVLYAIRLAREVIAQRLSQGTDIVLDTTNAEGKFRSRTIEIAKERGALVVGYWVATPLEVCLKRHATKQAAISRPPFLNVVTQSHAKMQANPPTFEEGFDVTVQLGGERPRHRCIHVFGHAVTPAAVRMLLSLHGARLSVLHHPVEELDGDRGLEGFIVTHPMEYVYAVRGDVSDAAFDAAVRTHCRCSFGELPPRESVPAS